MPLLPVAVAEDDHADNVDEEPHPAHDQDHLRVLDLLHEDEPLDGLDRDGEAEGEQEHRVDERAHHLGPRVAVGVLTPLPRRDPHAEAGPMRGEHGVT